jgi:hypothetical protein
VEKVRASADRPTTRFHLSATAQAMAPSWGTKAKPLGVGVFEPTCLTWIKDADCGPNFFQAELSTI